MVLFIFTWTSNRFRHVKNCKTTFWIHYSKTSFQSAHRYVLGASSMRRWRRKFVHITMLSSLGTDKNIEYYPLGLFNVPLMQCDWVLSYMKTISDVAFLFDRLGWLYREDIKIHNKILCYCITLLDIRSNICSSCRKLIRFSNSHFEVASVIAIMFS